MITETSAVAFRQNLGEMLNLVQYRHDSILIKKDGKPVAALVDARLFERIRLMQARFDALCDRLAKAYDTVPEEAALAEIEQAATRARRETADAWRKAGRLPSTPASAAKSAARRSTRRAGSEASATSMETPKASGGKKKAQAAR